MKPDMLVQASTSKSKTPKKQTFQVRLFERADAENVATLLQDHFPWKKAIPHRALAHSIRSNHPDSSPIFSLVCTSDDGEIHGYISVQMLDFLFKDQPVKGAFCSDFAVNEQARAALAPLKMIQQVLKGEQDFSFSDDAVDVTRMLWCRLGGEIAYPYSIYYVMPLRPVELATSLAFKNSNVSVKNTISTLSAIPQKLFEWLPIPFFNIETTTSEVALPLSPENQKMGLSGIKYHYELHQAMNEEKLTAYIQSFHADNQYGVPIARALFDKHDQLVGWFAYILSSDRRANVLHAESLPGKEKSLLINLRKDAYLNGAVQLNGRFSPPQLSTEFTSQAISQIGKKWVLVHSKNHGILSAFRTGKVFLANLW